MELKIVALRPGDCELEIELLSAPERVAARITQTQTGAMAYEGTLVFENNRVLITRLINYIDYSITLRDLNGGEWIQARLFRCGYVPGRVVNYAHPKDDVYMPSGHCLASPTLLRLKDGALLCVHDTFFPPSSASDSYVFRSPDNGRTWSYAAHLTHCFWPTLFEHGGRVFILCLAREYAGVTIRETTDGGYTWRESAPLTVAAQAPGGPHRAPAPLKTHGGRLWASLEYGSWASGGHMAGHISIAEDGDPMNPGDWVVSGFLPYDPAWPGTVMGDCEKYLEGNIVLSPEGRLINFMRYQTRKGTPAHGKAILLEIDPKRPEAAPRFFKVVNFMGNMSKFHILWDEQTRLYWALCNRVVTDMLEQRNLLSLVKSKDLIDWTLHRDIINFNDNGWFEDEKFVGFQYPSWLFDDQDILFVSRTALNQAIRYHDSNMITFHRIRNFRK